MRIIYKICFHLEALHLNPVALRTAKTPWTFGQFECLGLSQGKEIYAKLTPFDQPSTRLGAGMSKNQVVAQIPYDALKFLAVRI